MRGPYSHSREYRKIVSRDEFPHIRLIAKFVREFIAVRIHIAPVFAPARIQKTIPGELFMHWFYYIKRFSGHFFLAIADLVSVMGAPLVSLVSPELGSLGLILEEGASERRPSQSSDYKFQTLSPGTLHKTCGILF